MNNTAKRVGIKAAVTAAAAAALVTGLPAAGAHAAASDCGGGYLCVWTGANYTAGHWFETSSANDQWGWIGNPVAIRNLKNADSSSVNHWNTHSANIYADDGYTTFEVCIPVSYQIDYSGDWRHNNGQSHKNSTGTSGC
jgi:hypothetical protein